MVFHVVMCSVPNTNVDLTYFWLSVMMFCICITLNVFRLAELWVRIYVYMY